MPAVETEATEATDAVARDAWRAVHQLVFSARSQARMHDVCESLDLRPGLMRALFSMRPGEPRPMRDLAGEWRCDASYVTSLVDGLEERGIVERQACPGDRRAKLVVLTPAGERTRQQLLDRMHEPPPFFSALEPAEARQLRHLLAKLVDAAGAG